jgi:hypothetical protein
MPAIRPLPRPVQAALAHDNLDEALQHLATDAKDLFRRLERDADKASRAGNHGKHSRALVALSDLIHQLDAMA